MIQRDYSPEDEPSSSLQMNGGGFGRPPHHEARPQKEGKRSNSFRVVFRSLVFLVFVAVFLGVVYFTYTSVFGNKLVALVNGEEIREGLFEAEVSERKKFLERQAKSLGVTGENFETFLQENDTTIRQQVLTAIISRRLVLQGAQKSGVSVSLGEVDATFQDQVKNIPGDQNLESLLAGIGVTKSEVKAEIREQMTINKYVRLHSRVDTTVDRSEVGSLYSTLARRALGPGTTSEKKIPTFSEVEGELEARLFQRRQLLAAQDILLRLQAGSKVVVYPDDLAYPPIQGSLLLEKNKNTQISSLKK